MTQFLSLLESLSLLHFSFGFGHVRADSSFFFAGPDFEHVRTSFFASYGSDFEFIRANPLYIRGPGFKHVWTSLFPLFFETFFSFFFLKMKNCNGMYNGDELEMKNQQK